MRRRRRIGLWSLGVSAMLASGLLGAGFSWAQERPSGDHSSQFRRVPPFFGQIGLIPQQREQIYTIRGEYDQKIADLERQLDELKVREILSCEGVLTPAQKQLLDHLRAARGYGPTPPLPTEAPASARNDAKKPALNSVKVDQSAKPEGEEPAVSANDKEG